jgi:methionyl-tRNA formyltransferase
MKAILFSGSHPRHFYIHEELIRSGVECAVVIMQREQLIPSPPLNIPDVDRINFERHFSERNIIEANSYGDLHPDDVFSGIPILKCQPEALNSDVTVNFVRKFDADFAFIFGTDLIKEPVLSALPEVRINLHLGLSPWYRGSATLFWPFYFLQPQFAGATFHQILPEADAGGVLHQTVPILSSGDGSHDVGANTVIAAKRDFGKLLKGYANFGWNFEEQKSSGRLFLTRDFQAAHLRNIYSSFDNDIVDCYLAGQLEERKPKLVISKLVAEY